MSPSLRNHNEQEEPPPTMIASIVSRLHAEEDAPPSPVINAADRSPTAEESAVGAAGDQPYEHMPGSLSSTEDLNEGEQRAARRRDASSASNSIESHSTEDTARKDSPGMKRGSAQDATERSISASNVVSVQDVAETSSRTKTGSVQDAAQRDFLLSNRGSVQDVDKTSADKKDGSPPVAAQKDTPASNVEPIQDIDKTSPRTKRGSIQNAAENSSNSGRESVRNITKKSSQSSSSGPAEDTAEMGASASDHGLLENTVSQDDTEIPVAYESASMYLREQRSVIHRPCTLTSPWYSIVTDVPLKEEKPATPTTTPIPPLMDRVSVPSTSVPYYATPKIMVHRPSQSSEETPASRTIDQVLANERQSMPQETTSQSSHTTPDVSLMTESPMQSMSLKPIAWQAPPDQKVQKRKLYLRKMRNAAARKTILKATLGRQLAIPTKQMLRLLANGENLTIPDVSKSGVEAATMLVPQEAVESVTGAILLPQGVGGPVPEE